MSRLEEIKEKVNSDFEATKKIVHVVDGVELDDMNFAIEYKHIKWLINHIEELEKYKKEADYFFNHYKISAKKSLEENNRYKQALEYYANQENWKVGLSGEGNWFTPVDIDHGEKARETLAGDNYENESKA